MCLESASYFLLSSYLNTWQKFWNLTSEETEPENEGGLTFWSQDEHAKSLSEGKAKLVKKLRDAR